jgi:hypothetical protein
MSRDKGKGKARAEPTEESPLLASTSQLEAPVERPRSRPVLSIIAIGLLSLLLSAILFLALLAYSFKPSESELDALPRTAFRYEPPHSVSVLNVTEHGVMVNVSMRCGVDMDRALGVQGYADAEARDRAAVSGERGAGAAWWEELRRWTVRVGAPKTALVDVPKQVIIAHKSMSLLSLHLPSTLSIPLVAGASDKRDWLRPIHFTALAKPLASTGQLFDFAQKAWADGSISVNVHIDEVEAHIPGWPSWAQVVKKGMALQVDMPGEWHSDYTHSSPKAVPYVRLTISPTSTWTAPPWPASQP